MRECGKEKDEILEEVFYGGGKRKKRSKEERGGEGLIKGKVDLRDQSKGKKP